MRISAALVLALVVTSPVLASESSDVLIPVHQFIDGLNSGDLKSTLAACASPVSIIDDIPPHSWQGPNACADWLEDFDAFDKKAGVTDEVLRFIKVESTAVTGDRAYFIALMGYKYKARGKPVSERGLMTMALHKEAGGWRITAWTWSKQ